MSLLERSKKIGIAAVLLAVAVGFATFSIVAQNRKFVGKPATKHGLLLVLKGKQYQSREIVAYIIKHGVDFRLTKLIRKELIVAGARPMVLLAIEKNYLDAGKSGGNGSIKPIKDSKESGKYQNLITQAMKKLNEENDAAGAVEILERAINSEPGNFRAYQLLGSAYLEGYRDFDKAEKYMKESIKRGGSAVFKVRHADDASFFTSCKGSLYINEKGVRYEDDGNNHTIDVFARDIKKVKTSGGWGKFIRFKRNVFEILYRDRTNKKKKDDKDMYRFSPLSGKKKETKLIVKFARKLIK